MATAYSVARAGYDGRCRAMVRSRWCGGVKMLDERTALAALAGDTFAAAATTHVWEVVGRKAAPLLGGGDRKKEQLAKRRLKETRQQLEQVSGRELEKARADLGRVWQVRLADLLDEDPGVEAELRALVEEILAQLPPGTGAVAEHAAAGQDVTTSAAGAGAAAGELAPQRREVAGLPVSLGPRPTLLAGREEMLADLDAWLSGHDEPLVVALCGPGGAGKTSVAVEYAHRHLAEVGLAWQFPAGDREVLLAEFARLAARLGVREVVDARDPVASVHAALAAFPAGWLLEFDNAIDYETVRGFLPPAGRGRVLITSRSAAWPRGWAVEVPVLGTRVAAEFLVNRTGDPNAQAAEDLAEELGGLPLALEQAVAYIRATGTTLAEYLSLVQDRRDELLARGEAAGHSMDVAVTSGLALFRLADESPAAAGLMGLLAWLAPEPVPLTLLLADPQSAAKPAPATAASAGALPGGWAAVGDTVAALRRYSLVAQAGDDLVLVHHLVQHAILAQLSAEMAARYEQVAVALVEAAIPADPELPEAWPACAVLLPHARATLDLTSGGMWRIARFLSSSGTYPAARDLFVLIAEAHRDDDAYGPEHRDTLAAFGNLARWTGEAGDAAGARDEYAELLPIAERVLGPEHPATLTTRTNLARWTGEAGDAAAARDHYAALVDTEERALGLEHPHTLDARARLAHWTGEAGNAAAASDQYAELLLIRERILGPDHRDTLDARASAAYWTGEAGDAAGARDQYAALLPIHERVLGPEHPDTQTTRDNLAAWTGEAGDAAGARDRYAALLPIDERVLGPEHPDTLTTRANLAAWTGQAGDAAGARDQFSALLAIYEQVLGPEHPDTLTTRASLAYWTGEAGDAAAARDQYAELLPVRARVLGPEHPDTLDAGTRLAAWTGEAGNAAAARDQYAELLPVRARVLGREHPETLTTRASLAAWTGGAGDAAAARDQYAELLPVRARVLGPEHPDTLTTRGNLAYWARQSGG
jgi:Tetratricopeptide repeat